MTGCECKSLISTVTEFLKFCQNGKNSSVFLGIFIHFIHQYSALRPVLAGTRTQSGDRYGSGTLHPGQFLRGRLPLLSPAFRRSHLLRQVPSRRERPLAAEGGTLRGREMFRQILSRIRLPRNSRDLLHAANLRHGTDGFTSPPKEGVLRIFSALKNPTASAGFEPTNLGTKSQHATSRPPKPIFGDIWKNNDTQVE